MHGGPSQSAIEDCTNLTLPKPEVTVFGRDPVEYLNFVKAFERLI